MNADNAERRSPFSRGLQHENKRAAVLSCAAKLFNSKGARSTTLADVAARLGLTKTSLYYYVDNKEDLIYQCYEHSLMRAHRQLDEVLSRPEQPLEHLLSFLEQQIMTTLQSLDGKGDYYAAPLEFASLNAAHRDALEREYRRLLKRLIELLRAGITAGEIRDCNPVLTIRAIIGALDWSFHWLYEMPREDANRVVAVVRDVLAHGLLATGSAYRPDAHLGVGALANAPSAFDREARNRRKQEAFLKAGTRCFNQKGFTGTSLDEIADQLQVSKGAFYYHFANKEALLTQCFDFALDQLDAVMAGLDALSASPAEKIDRACRQIFILQNSDQGPLVHFNAITALPPAVRRRLLDRVAKHYRQLTDLMNEAIREGEFRPVHSDIFIQLMGGALNASMDIETWQPMASLDSGALDYFSVFFHGLASDIE